MKYDILAPGFHFTGAEKTMAPLVSIIIPVYNVFPYIREALDSVIKQTYHNLEIIIVDDGSTDGSGLVCDEYKRDVRVKVIHQENRGLSGARNTGLNMITGEYITFLDPDDALCSDMIEKLMQTILHYDADIAMCGYDTIETDGALTETKRIMVVSPVKKELLSCREVLVALVKGWFSYAVWNKVFIAKLWKGLRFPEKVVYEDLRVLPSLLERSKSIAVIPQILVHHRKWKGSITQIGAQQNVEELIEAYRLFLGFIENVQPAFSKKSISLLQGKLLRSLIFCWAELRKQGAAKEALDVLKKEIYELERQTDQLIPIKSKVVWWLFCGCPQMLLPVRTYFRRIKCVLCNQGDAT